MLDKVIRELTAKGNNNQMTSKDVLVWAKRIGVQWAKAAILNEMTELQKFDKVKMAQKPKAKQDVETHPGYHKWPCRYCGGSSCNQTVSSIWKNMCQMWKYGSLEEGMQE